MVWLYYLILLIVLVAGWLMTIVTLPGLWLMAGALAAFGWVTQWNRFVGWHSVIAMLVLAGIAEVIELSAGAVGSKVGGGRRRGMLGALVGGIVGAIFFTGIAFFPVGTIIGVCLGSFLGAAIAELSDRGVRHSFRVGVGAAGGRFVGILVKLAFGFVMLLVGMIAAFPIGGQNAAVVPPLQPIIPATIIPATLPATLPTTLP